MSKACGLIYVPILHTREEAASVTRSFPGASGVLAAAAAVSHYDRAVRDMWDGIARKLAEAHLCLNRIRIYQDALPVCGMEQKVVEKLAQEGSLNHQLILKLIAEGARLEGTEDPDLLLQEYEDLSALLLAGAVSRNGAPLREYQARSLALMEKRDAFIAQRIQGTLQEGELPLVFMGVRHRLEQRLSETYAITYLIYRLPFQKIGDIYNV